MKLRTALATLAVLGFSFSLPTAPVRAEEPEDYLSRLFEANDLKQLSVENKTLQVYRLTIIRSFHDPLLIEIAQDSGDPQLVVKKVRRETSGAEYRYTKLSRDSRLKLKNAQADNLRLLLEASPFWSMKEDWRRQGLDGSTWTLEAVSGGKYHKVLRDNPFLPVGLFEEIEKMGDVGGYKPLTPGQAYGEGLLAAVFSYMWALSGEDAEDLY